MIIQRSKREMTKSFEKTMYKYKEIPALKLGEKFGIYVNIPFCYSFCRFCPFYKHLFNETLKNHYVEKLVQEIKETDLSGKPLWIYFGGGTPNVLTIADLRKIVSTLAKKVVLHNLGIELLPAKLTKEYLKQLKNIGFSKISIGVESFSKIVNETAKRDISDFKSISELVEYAEKLRLFVNIDMMVGLERQSSDDFMTDIKMVSDVKPSQITIYPFMIVKGLKHIALMDDEEQFDLIEQAWQFLLAKGYSRKGPWTFTRVKGLYDSSKDELVDDYIGFGAGGFSTYSGYKIVNPELDVYLAGFEQEKRKALIAPKTKASDHWRRFARMISDLELKQRKDFPLGIRFFIWLLNISGYGRSGKLTEKGIYFAHHITKTVVESLPFPLQNPSKISNYQEYKKEAGKNEGK